MCVIMGVSEKKGIYRGLAAFSAFRVINDNYNDNIKIFLCFSET